LKHNPYTFREITALVTASEGTLNPIKILRNLKPYVGTTGSRKGVEWSLNSILYK